MKVKELIDKLQELDDPEAEVGYETGSSGLDLLIGEDLDSGSSIFIEKPRWP